MSTRPFRFEPLARELGRTLGIAFLSGVIAIVLFFASWQSNGLPASWRIVVMIIYWPGITAVEPVFRLIPYGGWVISLAHFILAVILQHLAIWALLSRWRRRKHPRDL